MKGVEILAIFYFDILDLHTILNAILMQFYYNIIVYVLFFYLKKL